MQKRLTFVLLGGVLAALVFCFWPAQHRAVGELPSGPEVKNTKHKADEEAIRKASADFARAVAKGDAKAVASFWTEEGEYIADDGTTMQGRPAIVAGYTKLFAKNPAIKLELQIESIRFPSAVTAIEEGYAKAYRDNPDQPTTSRYSVLHVRENDRWLMAVLREWPDEGTTLRDLDWLIGTWAVKTEVAEVHTTYAWNEKKTSIRVQFTIKEKGRTLSGTQIILKDPRSGQLRSWIFDQDGGFGDAVWSRDGKRWALEATGVQADGGELTATNILTRIDKDSFSWQSIDRTLDGEAVPNIPPVKVTRVASDK